MARKSKKIDYKICTFDFETDPFKYGRTPQPFCWGFYDGQDYWDVWNNDVEKLIDSFFNLLGTIETPCMIYAHNGGKFDFLYMMKYFTGNIRVVNGRVLEAEFGIHKFRDSYGILPIPLSATNEKMEIDYAKMEKEVREENKKEILIYLKQDCLALHNLVSLFVAEFGTRLTIGGTALNELKKFHPFEPVQKWFDEAIRPFYYGGRCQAFEKGILHDNFKVYDVNSMYPYVMAEFYHPYDNKFYEDTEITEETFFIEFRGKNLGALPTRTKQGLDFNLEYGTFLTTIHEYKAGIDTSTIEVDEIIRTINFTKKVKFDKFVYHFKEQRDIAKLDNDLFHNLFYKLILNSSYGKFGQNPENYLEWIITDSETYLEGYDEEGCKIEEHLNYTLWGKPCEMFNYFNIAVAASITGAARSVLLRAIVAAERPVYCDTDSIICTKLEGIEIDPIKLGAWDLEAQGDKFAIAGKKLYALFDGEQCVKIASKGATLVPRDIGHLMPENEPDYIKAKKIASKKAKNIGGEKILSIANGSDYHFTNDAPAFKLDGRVQFIQRTIRST